MPARPGCCLYSVRSYFRADDPDAGLTHWTADYWAGSTGSFAASVGGPGTPSSPLNGDVLRVAVDASGDVYVGGPRASTGGGGHWNLIKYNGSTGGVVWKADIVTGGDTGNIWSVLYNPSDGKLWVLGDATAASHTAVASRVDPSTGAWINAVGGSSGNGMSLIYDGTNVNLGPIGLSTVPAPSAFPYYQTIAGGRLVTFGSMASGGADVGQMLVLSDLPQTGGPYHRAYLIQDFSAWPHLTPRAVDLIDGGSEQLIAATGSILYFNDSPSDTGKLVLLDTGVDTAVYPITYRWKDAQECSQLKFQDSSYLIAGANGTPTVRALRTSDGSKVFAHQHLQPTSIAISSAAIVTVGTRKHKATDVDFV